MCGKSITLNILYGWHCRWKLDLYTTLLRLTGNLYFSKEDGRLIQSDVTYFVIHWSRDEWQWCTNGLINFQLHSRGTNYIQLKQSLSIKIEVKHLYLCPCLSLCLYIYVYIYMSISIYLYLHPFHIYIYIHIHIYYLLCKMAYVTSNENLHNFCSPIPSVDVFAMLGGCKLQSKM